MDNNEEMPSNLFARAVNEVGYGDLSTTPREKTLAKRIK